MTEIVLIAAVARDRAIGKGGVVPWQLPDDLRAFKAFTMGKPLLMGRKTALSLGRALSGRLNLVLTRSGEAPWAGMEAIASIDQAVAIAGAGPSGQLCVIGGAEIYNATLPLAGRLRITHVDTVVESADAFFPRVDLSEWVAVSWDEHGADENHAFPFTVVEYVRPLGGVSAGGSELR